MSLKRLLIIASGVVTVLFGLGLLVFTAHLSRTDDFECWALVSAGVGLIITGF